MITRMSGKLSSLFISQGVIPAEDREVYEYSFETLLSTLFSFLVLFIIAIITGTIGYTALYLAGFIPLRLIAGGYHAKNHGRCFIILMCAYAVFLFLLNFLPTEIMMTSIILPTVVSVVLVFLIAPSDDSNKPMSNDVKAIGRKKSRVLVMSYALIVFALIVLVSDPRIPLSIALGNVTLSISLLANMVKYKIRRRNHTDICEEVSQNEET